MANDELIYRIRIEPDERSLDEIRNIGRNIEPEPIKVYADVVDALKSMNELNKATEEGIQRLVELQQQSAKYKNELEQLKTAQKDSGTLTTEQKARMTELEASIQATTAEYNKQQQELIAVKSAVTTTGAGFSELTAINQELASQIQSIPIDDATGKLKELQAQFVASKDAVASVKELNKANDDTIVSLVKIKERLDEYKKELQALKTVQKENGALSDEQKSRMVELETAIKATNTEYNKQQRDLIAVKAASTATGASYNELVSINKALAAEIKNLPLDDTTGRLKKLQAQYNANNEILKAFDKTMGNAQRTVGNYAEEIKKAIAQTGFFGKAIAQAQAAKENFQKAVEISKASLFASTEGLSGASKAFTIFNNVLKMSVIGLIVTALSGLIAVLNKTQGGIDALKGATAALNAVMNTLLDYLINVGQVVKSGIVQTFQVGAINVTKLRIAFNELMGDEEEMVQLQEQLKEQESDLAKTRAEHTDNVKKLADSSQSLLSDMIDNAKAAKDLSDREQELYRTETALLVLRAKTMAQIAQLRNDAKDLTKDESERQESLEKAIELEKKLLVEEQAMAAERLKIIQERNALSTSTDEDVRKEAEAQAALIELEERSSNRIRELNSELNAFRRRSDEAYRKAYEEAQQGKLRYFEQVAERERQIVKDNTDAELAELDRLIHEGQAYADAKQRLAELQAQSQLEAEIAHLRSKGQILQAIELEQQAAANQLRSELVRQGLDAETAQVLANEQTKLEYTQRYEQARTQIMQMEAQNRERILASVSGIAKDMISALFNNNKAAAIATTIINTAEAAMAAYKSMILINPFLAAAAAAAATAKGKKQIDIIRRTNIGSETTVSSAGTSTSFIAGNTSRTQVASPIGVQASETQAATARAQAAGTIGSAPTTQAQQVAGTVSAGQSTVIVNNKVEAKIDREGLAIAVAEGQQIIENNQIGVTSL